MGSNGRFEGGTKIRKQAWEVQRFFAQETKVAVERVAQSKFSLRFRDTPTAFDFVALLHSG